MAFFGNRLECGWHAIRQACWGRFCKLTRKAKLRRPASYDASFGTVAFYVKRNKKAWFLKKLQKLVVCAERGVGLGWAGEEDERVGWGGEPLLVAARP